MQLCQIDEVAQLGRCRPGQLIFSEVKFGDAAVGVGGYAVPFADWGIAEPVGVVNPVRPVRGVLERN